MKKDLDGKLANVLQLLSRQVALDQQITALGGDPARFEAAVAAAKFVEDPPLEEPYDYNGQQLVLGIIAGILIYLSLMINGQSVAQGVVEEKTSRVVELLLSTIKPWQLMAGKVLGIGAGRADPDGRDRRRRGHRRTGDRRAHRFPFRRPSARSSG